MQPFNIKEKSTKVFCQVPLPFKFEKFLKHIPEKGLLILSLNANKHIGIYSLKCKKLVKIICNRGERVNEVQVWNVYNSFVLTVCSSDVKIKQLTGQITFTHKLKSRIYSCVFVLGEQSIILGGDFKEILSYNIITKKQSIEFLPKGIKSVQRLEFLEEKSLLFVLSPNVRLFVYEWRTRSLLFDLSAESSYSAIADFGITNTFISSHFEWPAIIQCFKGLVVRMIALKAKKKYDEKLIDFNQHAKLQYNNDSNLCFNHLNYEKFGAISKQKLFVWTLNDSQKTVQTHKIKLLTGFPMSHNYIEWKLINRRVLVLSEKSLNKIGFGILSEQVVQA